MGAAGFFPAAGFHDLEQLTRYCYDAAWFWRLPPAQVQAMPLDELAELLDHAGRINQEIRGD